MKALLVSMQREFTLLLRNGISVYMLLAPAILALIFMAVFGTLQNVALPLVVDHSVPAELVGQLSSVAQLEQVADLASLQRRVAAPDAVAGLSFSDQQLLLIVEGNEPADFIDEMQAFVRAAAAAEDTIPTYSSERISARPPLVYELSLVCIFLLALFIGGACLGLNGVNEREHGLLLAFAVSPMKLATYVAAKLIAAVLLGALSSAVCALIIGRAEQALLFAVVAACSIFVTGMIVFLLMGFANNDVAAIGVLKIIMPLFSVVGLSAAFVPEAWHRLYYVLPLYWQYRAIAALINSSPVGFFLTMLFLTSLPWFLLVVWRFIKQTEFRRRLTNSI